MPVKSLVELSNAVIYKNIRELNSVGDWLPYSNVRHILLRVDQAAQLREIELNSPQIQGHTAEIWLRMIERDFPMEFKAKSYKTGDSTKWFRVWGRYKKDHDAALAESENLLKNAMAGLQQNKEMARSRVVSKSELPRGGRLTVKRGPTAPRDGRVSAFDFHGGKRMKVKSGADVMRKVRRERGEIAHIHKSLSRPTMADSSGQRTRLTHAPTTVLDSHRRAAQTDVLAKLPPQKSEVVTAHEAKAEFISDDDDSGDDPFDEDEEVDEPPRKKMRQDSAPAPVRAEAAPKRLYASTATSLLKKRPAMKPVTRVEPAGPSRVVAPSERKHRDVAAVPQGEPAPKPPIHTSPPAALAASPEAILKKRKPASIFMRPKKRPT